METWTIGGLARVAGVTARALRHWGEIGLLRPSSRSAAGYRLYARADLERLQEVLVLRALGLPLDEIRRQLDDPGHDRIAALRQHRAALAARLGGLARVLATVDATLAAHEQEEAMDAEELFAGFDPAEHEAEAEARWGGTAAHAEARRRTARYTPAEWSAQQAEAEGIARRLAGLMAGGEPASGARAGALAEEHRQHLERWFYACPPGLHRGLADLYVDDPRFRAWWERHGPGLADYVREAILAGGAVDAG